MTDSITSQPAADADLPPERLYKYRSTPSRAPRDQVDWHRESIADSRMYFAPPQSLNDPFDCEPCWVSDTTSADIEYYVLRAASRVAQRESRPIASEDKQRVLRRLRAPGYVENSWREWRDQQGVYSLSETAAEPLMWAHYGGSHAGYCLEFALNEYVLESAALEFVPNRVEYSRSRPLARKSELLRAMSDNRAPVEQFMRWMTVKDHRWSYEREWRLIATGRNGAMPFPPRLLTGIVLGSRCSEQDEELLRQWANRRPWPVAFRRAAPSSNDYALTLVDA